MDNRTISLDMNFTNLNQIQKAVTWKKNTCIIPRRLRFALNRPELDDLHAMLRTSSSVARSMTYFCRLNKERNALDVILLNLSICMGIIFCMALACKLSSYYRKIDRSWKRTKDLFIYYGGWHHVSGLIRMVVAIVVVAVIVILIWYQARN